MTRHSYRRAVLLMLALIALAVVLAGGLATPKPTGTLAPSSPITRTATTPVPPSSN